uniref:Peptidase S54 rhomboid domain-containing protein n=1 Tax=Solanum lycopersicum TaxID=4081 RepID=A0A3Q7J8F9_SOLLC
MQRLLSLKLLPQIHRNLSNGATNLSKANHCFSAPYTTSSHSWRLQNVKFSHGVFSNPLFSKQLLANTHFRGDPSKVLAYRTVGLGRTQLGRRNFHSNSLVGSIRRSWRSSYGRFSTDGVVLCLIFTNVAVFLLWRVADSRFMMRNFMISVDNFTSGRVHTLITSAFSHISTWHLVSNMIGLYFFGTSVSSPVCPLFF